MARDWSHDQGGNDESGGKERWLVTYADMMTLLLVFFIIMYALSTRVSGEKFDALANSLALSMKKQNKPKVSDHMAYSPDDSRQTRRFLATARAVYDSVKKTDPKSDVKINVDERGIVVSLVDSQFFTSGSAMIRPEAVPILSKIAKHLRGLPNDVQVEGHTDNAPIRTPQFPSNWELSSARASAVVRFFIEKGGIKPATLSARGYAEHRPVASNRTNDGRKRNRRVDIIVARREELQPITTGLTGAGGVTGAPLNVSPTLPPTPVPPPPKHPFNNPF